MSCTFSGSRRLLGGGGGLARSGGAGAVFAVRRGAPARRHEPLLFLRVGRNGVPAGSRPTGGTGGLGERSQVDGGVDVPVDDQAAVLAVIGALGERQFGFHRL